MIETVFWMERNSTSISSVRSAAVCALASFQLQSKFEIYQGILKDCPLLYVLMVTSTRKPSVSVSGKSDGGDDETGSCMSFLVTCSLPFGVSRIA